MNIPVPREELIIMIESCKVHAMNIRKFELIDVDDHLWLDKLEKVIEKYERILD